MRRSDGFINFKIISAKRLNNLMICFLFWLFFIIFNFSAKITKKANKKHMSMESQESIKEKSNFGMTTIKLKKIARREGHTTNMIFLAEVHTLLGHGYYDKFMLSHHSNNMKMYNYQNYQNSENSENLQIHTNLPSNNFLQKNMINKLSVTTKNNNSLSNQTIYSEDNLLSKTKIIPLKNFKNTQYIGNVKIGEPQQEIPVIFDTGSGNLWVTSSLCRSSSCKTKKSYNRHKSKKFSKIGLGVEVTFGTGSVAGEINQDTFKLGNISIRNQKFAEILEQRGTVFDNGKFSGILGLGYPDMSAYNVKTVFDTIINDKLLKKNIMAFYYSLNENTDGEVTFGHTNKQRYKGDIKYYPVTEKYYWTIKMDDILYDGKSLGLCGQKGCKAIADTGTTLLTGPTSDVRKLLHAIPVKHNCEGWELTGKLEFVFGGEKYELLPEEFIATETGNSGDKNCSALIMPLDVPEPHGPAWILGGTFLQKYYSVFDRDQDRVGFAEAVHKEEKKIYD